MSRYAVPLLLLAVGCGRPGSAPAPIADPVTEAVGDDIPPPRPVPLRTPDAAAGVTYLLKHQSPDGAWRSDLYAAFKDGTALTPLALTALQAAADAKLPGPDTAAARRKAADHLAAFAAPDGSIREPDGGFDYPVYTAALALKALAHPENRDRTAAREAWAKYLLARQLTEQHGWAPADEHYGGWGYCRVIPKRPEPDEFAPPLTESNLSATLVALDALAAAGRLTPEISAAALVALARWQNFAPPMPGALPPGWTQGDGGFFFVVLDPVRNKAGWYDLPAPGPGVPPVPPRRFGSYGSATADGLRALRLLKGEVAPGAAYRAQLAADWLAKHFRADRHPGQYAPGMEANRDAVYFYYAASVATAARAADFALPADGAAALAHALATRQTADGSWANPIELVRENDPLVATPQALTALAALRR